MKRNERKQRNPEHLLHVAKGFYDIGMAAAQDVKKDKSEGGFQRLPAAVINFNFAVELLLKALHLFTTGKHLEGHEIYSLYKQLPAETKTELEERFQDLRAIKNDQLTAYRIILEFDGGPMEPDAAGDPFSLKDILISHNHSFTNWRYLFEWRDEGYSYFYDFKHMNDFALSLIHVINKKLDDSPD
jgi:hypothetical protein